MYIASFNIYSFGIIKNAHAPDLSPGLNIFYGPNGSGKTTCMIFLSDMLTGADYIAGSSDLSLQNLSGSLDLFDILPESPDSSCKIYKNPGEQREITCASQNMKERILKHLSSVRPDEYKKFYGFGLSELEKFADASDEKAARMLFAATFGETLRSPAIVHKELELGMERIFGNTDDENSICGLLHKLEATRQKLAELESAYLVRKKDAEKLIKQKEALAGVRQTLRDLARDKRQLERRIAATRHWQEWRSVCERAALLSDAPSDFPAEAVKRLELILAARNGAEQQRSARVARIGALSTQLENLVCDQAILEQAPRLRQLAERKGNIEVGLEQKDSLREKKASLEKELKATLANLGTGWTCDQIRSIDRSLFAREKLEQSAEELTVAKEAYQAAFDALGTANQDVALSEQALETAKETYESLPEPESELTNSQRDELRLNAGRLQECQRQNQAREKNLENARQALARALEQARINPVMADGHINLDATRKSIDALLHSRDEGLQISSELREHLAAKELINERLSVLENNSETIRKKIDDLSFNSGKGCAYLKNSIDSRTRALQNLRANVSRLENTQEKLKSIEQQLSEYAQPVKSFRSLLIWPGIIILVAGLGLFALAHFGELKEIVLGDLILPLKLSWCYGLITCGVLLFALGLPAGKGANKTQRQNMARLQASRDSEMVLVEELLAENQNLALQAEIESTDPITLDATEMLLEREKVQSIHDERTHKDMEKLKEELQNVRMEIQEAQRQANALENEIQKCRKQWMDLLDRLRISDSPSPESAPTVFTRVEACEIALENVKNAENELNELWEDFHLLESSISALPAVSKRLEEASQPISLEDAVNQVLDACKNTDKMWQDKIQAEAALKTMENELAKARSRQEETAEKLENANGRLEKARADWRLQIAEFGTSSNADPQTMREALRLMDASLGTENSLETINKTIEMLETEIRDMHASLNDIMAALHREPLTKAHGETDLLGTLTSLLEDLEKNVSINNERKRIESLIASHNEDLAAVNAELATIDNREKSLLSQANAQNREEFLKLAEKYAEKQSLEQMRVKLESELAQVAGETSLNEFLNSFTNKDLEEAETEISSLQTEIDKLVDREQSLLNETALLSASANETSEPENMLALRQQKAMLSASLQKKCHEWRKYSCAAKLLENAVKTYETDSQPQLARLASSYFAKLLCDDHAEIRVKLDQQKLSLTDPGGNRSYTGHTNRSLGEMAHFALRLAYIHEMANTAGSWPMLMDDVLVNMDAENARRIAVFLNYFASSEIRNQQIFIFTCHTGIRDLFRENAPDARFFNMKNGLIEAV